VPDRWGSFFPDDVGSRFLRNISTVYRTTRPYVPEDHIFNAKETPRSGQGGGVLFTRY